MSTRITKRRFALALTLILFLSGAAASVLRLALVFVVDGSKREVSLQNLTSELTVKRLELFDPIFRIPNPAYPIISRSDNAGFDRIP